MIVFTIAQYIINIRLDSFASDFSDQFSIYMNARWVLRLTVNQHLSLSLLNPAASIAL